jgi:hypothetical protein
MTALKKFYDQALALLIKNPSAWILGALLNSAAYASYTLGRTLTKLWEGRRAPRDRRRSDSSKQAWLYAACLSLTGAEGCHQNLGKPGAPSKHEGERG